MRATALPGRDGRVTAVLGPTNTGKTHFAVERMLSHSNGVIGLPLRLLAREIYDRVVAAKGARLVALITGEEKIVPKRAAYFVCTVESMPTSRRFDFLGVDEIQLCADPERGHVFTDRLLHARGIQETMFMGADTFRPLLKHLVPDVEFLSRPRFSALTYLGSRKLSRLPRRSAIVAFSAQDVYAIAELMRRQRGGAAVVMGALSPRTRNAQVAMYQDGEVDTLVATDAIGMGLNMDIDHVAFAALRKFDGYNPRPLTAAEIGQIAGRAGRHLNDGSFGTTAEASQMDEELIEAVENHDFPAVKTVFWRNTALDFTSVQTLIRGLEAKSPAEILLRPREGVDLYALRVLAGQADIADAAHSPAMVRLLWQVCQIPDFRKTMSDSHTSLLAELFRHLCGGDGRLPTDWVDRHVERLDRTDGDIDTLASRISHIRTWTFISNRGNWLHDPGYWQSRTQAIEDKLSDALHEGLTRRFVDRRTAVLLGKLKDRAALAAAIDDDGAVLVEGHFVGRLKGLSFFPDTGARGADGRLVRAAAARVLGPEIDGRARRLLADSPDLLSLRDDGRIWWQGAPLAEVVAGESALAPRLKLLPCEPLSAARRRELEIYLTAWLKAHIAEVLQPLARLLAAEMPAAARGVAFQLGEGLGAVPRERVASQLRALSGAERQSLRRRGVTTGTLAVFMPGLLKPARARFAALLWRVFRGVDTSPLPRPGLVSHKPNDPVHTDGLMATGYWLAGERAIRLDMLERFCREMRARAKQGPVVPDHLLLSIIGCPREEFGTIARAIGYRQQEGEDQSGFVPKRRSDRRDRSRPKRRRKTAGPVDPSSPFAKLQDLKLR